MLHPRRARVIQIAGTLFLLALGLAFHFVPGLGFESGSLLLFAFVMVVGFVVLAIRPPATRLRHQALVVRKPFTSVVIDRGHYLGYAFQRASRVIGGDSASSNRSLVISYRSDDGSVHVIPAFWSYRWLGLLSIKEQTATAKMLDDWQSQDRTPPAS